MNSNKNEASFGQAGTRIEPQASPDLIYSESDILGKNKLNQPPRSEVKCKRCGYVWLTSSVSRYVTCARCGTSVTNTSIETLTMLRRELLKKGIEIYISNFQTEDRLRGIHPGLTNFATDYWREISKKGYVPVECPISEEYFVALALHQNDTKKQAGDIE